uniref:LysR family transcriptional regulator n=1 Tax=Caballeronia sp. LjRoot34 TaxID=3342325 RepID=UPI003F4FAE4A
MIANPFDLNLRHLRALVTVQECGSISAAARIACLSQSALTQGIAKIERQLECVLFERQSDGVDVTPEGKLALQRIGAALRHLDDAVSKSQRSIEHPARAVTMTHIRALMALAETGTFATAAEAAKLSPSSVHRSVGDLERKLDKHLLDRRGRGTLLSFSGNRLVRGFRLAAGELRAMVGEMRDDEHLATISFGALPVARPTIVPRAITRMIGENSRARFVVAEGDWQDLVDQLQDGLIDLIIGEIRNDDLDDLKQEALSDDQVVILCGSHHPLAMDPAPSLDVLAAYPWIVAPPLSPLRLHWENLFAHRARPDSPVECGSIMVMINLLAQSDFLTLASPRQVELPLQTKRLAQIGGFIRDSTRSIGITTRKTWRPIPMERRFMRMLAEAAECPGASPIASA